MNLSEVRVTLRVERPTKPLELQLPFPAHLRRQIAAATAPPSLVASTNAPRKGGLGGNLGNCGRNDLPRLFIAETRKARQIAERAA